MTQKKITRVVRIFKTINHPAILEIIQILEHHITLDANTIRQKLKTPIELAELLQYLAKMKINGILTTRETDETIYFQIADRKLLRIFDCKEYSHLQ